MDIIDSNCWKNGKRDFNQIGWYFSGFVYALEDKIACGMCKVGVSMVDPAIRMREISREMQKDTVMLVYWAFVLKPAVVEKQVHALLSDRRVQGEWFNVPAAEIIVTIRAVAGDGLLFDSKGRRI